ncbi:MAG: glycerate kinase [Polyangia bacterium]|jgi:glycerate kinase|nr:glycerate kinase [Polyangia bacterium]
MSEEAAQGPFHGVTVALAPDSFKGTLDAFAAAEAMERGALRALPGARCLRMPLADGGEGTAALLCRVTGGHGREVESVDPLGRPISATIFCLGGLGGKGKVWAVDTADASGLTRLAPSERDPLLASSEGTGRLLLSALAEGAEEMILGLGGSATVDGGKGLCQALGFRFLDRGGRELAPGGGSLREIHRIDSSGVGADVWRLGPRLRLACDVQSPLLGPRGAARVFGPQKGADPSAVELLEEGLARLLEVLREHPGPCGGARELATLPGTGAAGGIGACLRALIGASLEPGGALVIRAARYVEQLEGCDLVLVGEGRMDRQTLEGKAPAAMAAEARALGIPVLGITGVPGPGICELGFLEDWEAARGQGGSHEGGDGQAIGGELPVGGSGRPVGGSEGRQSDREGLERGRKEAEEALPDPVTAAHEVAAAAERLLGRWARPRFSS